MKYNEGSFLDRLKDDQYKSRVMLVVFIAVIIFMGIFIRISGAGSKTLEENNTENKKSNSTYTDSDYEYDYDPDELMNKFIYIGQNNYDFVYDITFGGETYHSSGKRCGNKLLFNFIYDNEEVLFYANNDTVMNNLDKEGKKSRYPYFFVNYYDYQNVAKLVASSKYSEEDKMYHISNEELYRLGDREFINFKLENPSMDNTIELKEINGKVIGVKMDFTNLFNSGEAKMGSVVFDLNYSNFGFVEDFEVPF